MTRLSDGHRVVLHPNTCCIFLSIKKFTHETVYSYNISIIVKVGKYNVPLDFRLIEIRELGNEYTTHSKANDCVTRIEESLSYERVPI